MTLELPIARRALLARLAGAGAGLLATSLLGCDLSKAEPLPGLGGEDEGHLRVRPTTTPTRTQTPGTAAPLSLGSDRDGQLYVPASYTGSTAIPVVLSLHGASQNSATGLALLRTHADARGFAIVAPDSRGGTWDRVRGRFLEDVQFIELALALAFATVRADPARIWIAGFSDGATYSLSLGATNGDLFSKIVAFSPGFWDPNVLRGKPKVFVSHGTLDPVLPIDRSSRTIVPAMTAKGYDVTYREFDGTHTVPSTISAAAATWLSGT